MRSGMSPALANPPAERAAAILPLSDEGRRAIARWTAAIERELSRTLPAAQAPPSMVHEAMRYCVGACPTTTVNRGSGGAGGKRFRPLLCLGGCEAVGGPARQALRAACAIELIHTYSLVHDDLPAMDDAELRRGRPACHRQFGEGRAILVGDALLTLAFERLSRDRAPRTLAVLRAISEAAGTTGLIGGQALDLEARLPLDARGGQAMGRPDAVSEEEWRDIARRKTAALITASVVAGGLAGGASRAYTQPLARYGRDLGLAFQLIDDLHDADGLAGALGAEATRAEARQLIARAIAAVKPFGPRADLLRHLAAWLWETAG